MNTPRPCKKCGTVFAIWNCPVCAKKRKSDWVNANKEKKRVADQAWARANKEKLKSASKKWNKANPEKARAATATWKKNNPEKHRINEQNRNKRKHANGGRLSSDLVQRLTILQQGKCPCCRLPLGSSPHLDHIMPLALGGMNVDENMQLLHKLCNSRKHAKHPVEFMQQQGFLL